MDKFIDMNNNNLLEQVNTPSYIFDLSKLNNRIKFMRDKLKENINLCYAMKANPFIVKHITTLVDRLEVCSYGEYEICKRENINPDKIIVSGVNKTKETIDKILEYSKGRGIYTIESEKHVDILTHCANEKGYKLKVIIRLTSGNQFGVDRETFENIVNRINDDKKLNLIGIHYYSGTQKKMKKIAKEISGLDEYAKHIKEKFAIKELELEYGPGLMVEYFQDDKIENEELQLEQLQEMLCNIKNFNKITLEFGRFISYNCGYYCTKINDVKNNGYVIIDGGIHQVNYYGQIMGMKKPFIKRLNSEKKLQIINNDDECKKWTLCGSLCTANDVLVRDVPIDKPCEGEVFIFENVGAYSVTEGMALFLSRELPAIYIYSNEEGLKCIRNIQETNRLVCP